jgi:CRISPR-associated protein Cmr5
MILAEKCVSEVEKVSEPGDQKRDVYGGLCHSFPIMVRQCGLCQAVAFSADKSTASGARGEAHKLLLAHVGELLGEREEGLLSQIRSADTMQYIMYSRRVLAAWIYYKRFAVSILKVESAREVQNVAGD